MAGMTKEELDRAIREVIKRTIVDPEFRVKALTDSNAAVEAVAKRPLPEGTSIRFVQNYGKSTRTFTLPDPVPEGEHLLEQDLEQVAGGIAIVGDCGSSCGSNSCLNT